MIQISDRAAIELKKMAETTAARNVFRVFINGYG